MKLVALIELSLLLIFNPRTDATFEDNENYEGVVDPADTFDVADIVVTSSENENVILQSTIVERQDDNSKDDGGQSRSYSFVGRKKKQNVKDLIIKLKVKNVPLKMKLRINKYLFSADYKEKILTKRGEKFLDIDLMASHCYYTGSVNDSNNNVVAISTCNGINGLIKLDSESYRIEPMNKTSHCLSCQHKVMKENVNFTEIVPLGCGTTDFDMFILRNETNQRSDRKKRATLNSWPQDLDRTTRVVEVYVVNSFSQYTQQDSDPDQTNTFAKQIINMVSLFYHVENIYVVLVGMETWTVSEEITILLGDASQTLSNFRNYSETTITAHRDNTMLFLADGPFGSADKPIRSILGVAKLQTMCGNGAVLFSRVNYTVATSAAITAHELGHNFGLYHTNDSADCPCTEASGLCIMNARVDTNNPATKFSQCSKDNLTSIFLNGLDDCLHNMPPVLFDPTAICGNGLVEDGEDCDCGNAPITECNPECCDNTTCKLISPNQCAYGRCCDVPSCTLKPRYTECRPATGECDLSEYCSGSDHRCPTDVFRQDYTPCTVSGDSAYCYGGNCRSRNSECEKFYGAGILDGPAICYTSGNKRADFAGSCGFTDTSNFYTSGFKPCANENVYCGSLHCKNEGKAPPAWLYAGFLTYTGDECTFLVYPEYSDDGESRGFVPNGASCETGKVCFKQECVDVTTKQESCSCTANGVCNSLGQCHCNEGYGGTDCTEPGEGGSPHSNPIKEQATTSTLTTTHLLTTTSTQQPSTSTSRSTTTSVLSTTASLYTSLPLTTGGLTTTSRIVPTSIVETSSSSEGTTIITRQSVTTSEITFAISETSATTTISPVATETITKTPTTAQTAEPTTTSQGTAENIIIPIVVVVAVICGLFVAICCWRILSKKPSSRNDKAAARRMVVRPPLRYAPTYSRNGFKN